MENQSTLNSSRKRRKSNNNDHHHKKTKTLKKLPKFIAQGSFGCVYSPPFKCKESNTSQTCNPSNNRCEKGIAKVIDNENLKYENYEYLGIHLLDPKGQYHILYPHVCDPLDNNIIKIKKKCDLKIENPKLLISKNGGIELYQLMEDYIKEKEEKEKTDITNENYNKFFVDILIKLKNILDGIILLNKNNIFHLDIKNDNIICENNQQNGGTLKKKNTQKKNTQRKQNGGKLGLFRLIDFGLSDKIEKGLNEIPFNSIELSGKIREIHPIYSILLDCDYLNSDNKEHIEHIKKNLEYFFNYENKKKFNDTILFLRDNRIIFEDDTQTMEYLLSIINALYFEIMLEKEEKETSKFLYNILKSIDLYSFGFILLDIYKFLKEDDSGNLSQIQIELNNFLVQSKILDIRPFYTNDTDYDIIAKLYDDFLKKISNESNA